MRYLILIVSVLLSTAQATELTKLMPRDTVLALGIVDAASLEETFPGMLAAWQGLDIVSSLLAMLPSEEATRDEIGEALSEGSALLAQEAWLSLSVSSYNPLPSALLMTRLTTEQRSTMLDTLAGMQVGERLREGDYSFYATPQQGDSRPLFYALAEDVLMLATNPDSIRAALRQLAGDESGFAASDGYRRSLATMPQDATLYSYLDYAKISSLLSPYAAGFGIQALAERLEQSLNTLGISAGYAKVVEQAGQRQWYQYGMQVLDPQADAQLYDLMTEGQRLELDTLRYMPADALSYSHNVSDIKGWYQYLNAVIATVPWLDGDPDETIELFLGVSLQDDFVGLLGAGTTSIVLEAAEVNAPGIAAENLLGDSVYIFSLANARAADSRLQAFFTTLARELRIFTDPMGEAEAISTDTITLEGQTAHVYPMADGITIAYTIVEDALLLASSQDALARVLAAPAGQNLARTLRPRLPATARSYTYSNTSVGILSTSQQLVSQIELLAGISGSANLDFNTVESTSQKLESAFSELAERLGQSSGYSYVRDGVLYSETYTNLR